MGGKDTAANAFLADNRRFADICNYYLYHGQERIRPDMLKEQDPRELLQLPSGQRKQILIQKYRDLLKNAVIRSTGKCTYLIIGIENQSEIHYAMPLRSMLYDALNYSRQAGRTAERHRREKDWENTAEFLSGFRKEDRLTPVVTITVYWGNEKWDGPRSLHDMLEKDEPFPDIARYVADYKLNLIAPSEIENFDQFHTSVREVLELLKYAGDERAMDDLIRANPAYRNLENEAVQVINRFANLELSISETEGETNMCKAWDDHKKAGIREGKEIGRKEGERIGRQEGREEGRQEGREEGRLEGVDAMIRLGEIRGSSAAQVQEDISLGLQISLEEARRLYDRCMDARSVLA